MDNYQVAESLALTARLMELHGENPFKIKAIYQAAELIEKHPVPILSLPESSWQDLKGIGKGIITKLTELKETGTSSELNSWLNKTPSGLLDLLELPGLGPKKTHQVWKELNVESLGELQYACNENRLASLKGFGQKTQQTILKNISFKLENSGLFLYARVEEAMNPLAEQLNDFFGPENWSFCGAMARKAEVVSKIEIIAIRNNTADLPEWKKPLNLDVVLIFSEKENFESEKWKHACSEDFKKLVSQEGVSFEKTNAVGICSALGLPHLAVEMLEHHNLQTLKLFGKKSDELIMVQDLKGGLHMHSTWSDGSNTLEEMALACKQKGWDYLGISDHSQSAFYANGLKPDRVFQQHEEINLLNKKLAPFFVYRGIESDILHDGSLDYDDETLKLFDFIVASIHSGLKMDEEKATSRLIKAIENPYTRILGHMTGRLLLSRAGYPLNTKKVIEACAQNNVCIELNSHPSRLDIDWRWIPYCLEKNVLLSINPDAHNIHGIHDVQYGINVGRKGGLTAAFCLNSKSKKEFDHWLSAKK